MSGLPLIDSPDNVEHVVLAEDDDSIEAVQLDASASSFDETDEIDMGAVVRDAFAVSHSLSPLSSGSW